MPTSDHKIQVERELVRLTALFLEREGNRDALITVTRADLTPDSKQAIVYFSVMPTSKEHGVLDFAKRKRAELRSYIKENIRTRVIPFIDVAIDEGEKNRQRIDMLLKQ